jgi:heme exporter protein D
MSGYFSMGGHGFYIWGSYLACALVMAIEPLLVLQRQRRARQAAQAAIDEEN